MYPKWPQARCHDCPSNVVELKNHVLQQRLEVDPAHIAILSGWPDRVEARPTHANIRLAFQRLAANAIAGDQVAILMAGHGSQEPVENDPDEPDGLNETFLPADTANWDATTMHVKNAIIDDEIRDWLTAIRAEGASVWIVFDSCHSGTMTRGIGERMREIPMHELVPESAIATARRKNG